ncbi:MAG: porin [Pseudomonadota bacterium]|nr:porin [Pseudomonadota bacterium]
MKKAIFLTVTGAVLASPALAQSSVQLYGIVDLAYRHTTNEGTAESGSHKRSLTRMIGGGFSQSRIGINVNEDMGNGLRAIANFEQRINAQDGSVSGPPASPTDGWQLAWVGLQSSSFGRVTMGRQWNVLFDLVTSTYASFPYSPYMDAYKPEIGFSLGARTSSALKYTIEVGPVRGALQYSTRNDGGPTGGATKGGYIRYAQGGWAAGAGYLDYEFGSGKHLKGWTVGGSYRTGPWYFNLGYGENKADSGLSPIDMAVLASFWGGNTNGGFGGAGFLAANKRQMATAGVNYQLTPQLNLGVHYWRARQTGHSDAAKAHANFILLVADYAFSKRTDAYFGVDRTTLSGEHVSLASARDNRANGAKSRWGVTVGMRHRF